MGKILSWGNGPILSKQLLACGYWSEEVRGPSEISTGHTHLGSPATWHLVATDTLWYTVPTYPGHNTFLAQKCTFLHITPHWTGAAQDSWTGTPVLPVHSQVYTQSKLEMLRMGHWDNSPGPAATASCLPGIKWKEFFHNSLYILLYWSQGNKDWTKVITFYSTFVTLYLTNS